jgi:hypothetical protein
MDLFKIAVKIFATSNELEADAFVPVFHHWIQNQSVEGHRLIDVADYGHVVNGPGTVLVSSEANFYTDRVQGRLGLLYSRKLPLEGDFSQRVRAAVKEAIKAAGKLEREPALAGKLKFKTDEILIRLNDRLLAPANEKTVAAAKGDIDAEAKRLYGEQGFSVESSFTAQTLVEFRIISGSSPGLAELEKRA